MAEARIPVDLLNPGQVFACLGFLEAADVLLGGAEGGFDWRDPADTRFVLRADGEADPVGEVLDYLAAVEPRRFAPASYRDPPAKKKATDPDDEAEEQGVGSDPPEPTETFPSPEADRMSLPIRLGGGNRRLTELTHWADGSGRDTLKLYAGNRSALAIARSMLRDLKQLLETRRSELVASPLRVTLPMGGSFNFDPRGAWTALDAGYSLNEHKHRIEASPVVEILAAWGLEHGRPMEVDLRLYRYAAWADLLPPALSRPALAGCLGIVTQRRFRVRLELSGKNKVMTFAEEE